MLKDLLKKILFLFQFIFVSIYIIFEELVWERFAEPIFKYIKHLRLFKRLEIILRSTNRYILLGLFLLSFVVGELVGIASPIVALKGFPLLGILLYGVKLLIVAFAFWLYNTQKEKLLSFWFIDYSYKKILQFSRFIKNSYMFKLITSKAKHLKEQLKIFYKKFKSKIADFLNKK